MKSDLTKSTQLIKIIGKLSKHHLFWMCKLDSWLRDLINDLHKFRRSLHEHIDHVIGQNFLILNLNIHDIDLDSGHLHYL